MTRPRVIRALRMLETKVDTMPRKKHGTFRYRGDVGRTA